MTWRTRSCASSKSSFWNWALDFHSSPGKNVSSSTATTFYIDLLFYNRKLKRLVVVELKQGSFKPEYKGQMELYLRWLAQNEREPEENLPLGIILCAGKNTEQIELLELDAAGIHVAEYLTVLPPPEVLRAKLHEAIEVARTRIQTREEDSVQQLPKRDRP